jgi:hypothetical protein
MGKIKDTTIPDHDQHSHDPLCRAKPQDWAEIGECLDCALIARVREDQTERCVESVNAYAYARLLITRLPNRSEDITAALQVAANRLRDLKGTP